MRDLAEQIQLPVIFCTGTRLGEVLTAYPRSRIHEFESGSMIPFIFEKALYIAHRDAIPVVYSAYFGRQNAVREVLRSEGVHAVKAHTSTGLPHRKRFKFYVPTTWMVESFLRRLLSLPGRYRAELTIQLALDDFFGGIPLYALQQHLERLAQAQCLETKIGQTGTKLYRWSDVGGQNQNDAHGPGNMRFRRSAPVVSTLYVEV